MRRAILAAIGFGLGLAAMPAGGAHAQPAPAPPGNPVSSTPVPGTLARLRDTGILRCAAEERPGFADADETGQIHGLAVDLCRAVALAVIGPHGQVQMALPDSDLDFDKLASGADLVLLSGAAFAEHHLTQAFIPGPVVFIEPETVMVPVASKVITPADLSGKVVCLMIGSPAHRALEESLAALQPPIIRLSFREDVEMWDAYNVGRCDAVADDATRLAEERQNGGINHLQSRLLDRPVGLTPVMAATPAADGPWSATVGWVLLDLMQHDDDAPMAVPGLAPDWPARVKASVGTYRQMLDRNLGAGSPLNIATPPNAPWPTGALLTIRP